MPTTDSPTWQDIRRAVGLAAKERGEYAGIPVPVEESPLVIAPSMPFYKNLHGCQLGKERRSEDDGAEVVNSWQTEDWPSKDVFIYREGGKLLGASLQNSRLRRFTRLIRCLGISLTMDVEAERRAMETLRGLIKPHLASAYEMTGMFLETSPRSGVTYVFRRLATTVALKPDARRDDYHFLAALCLHPLGYYEGLPMGVMVPTDDVISHLVLMRTDEHLFWRKCNQHPSSSPGAML